MGFRKLIFVAFLVLEGCCVFSQYVVAPGTCSCISSSPITPAGQFVIPAIIKPILQPEPVAMPCPAPVVPNYSDAPVFGGLPAPFPMQFGGMPPIIVDDDNNNSSKSLLYYLILALARRNRYGGNGNGNGYGGCGNGCGGGYGGCSNSGSSNNGYYSGCNSGCNGGCNGGYNGGCNYNNYGDGNGCNNGYGMNYGSCGCGGFNGNGCSNGCTYIPYPIPVSCCSPFDNCYSNDNSCSCAQENQSRDINLIIRTPDDGASN